MSQDLQASHDILSLLEKSKQLSDEIVDQLPGLILTVTTGGTILRANREIARLLPISLEDALDLTLTGLFTPENWWKFKAYLDRAAAGDEVEEFELSVGVDPCRTQVYLWKIQVMRAQNLTLLNITGRDVSEIKAATARLLEYKRDQEIMATVQTLLLPHRSRFETAHVKGAGHYQPADAVGGDWWWHEELPDESLIVAVGDITGHGVGPAMVTSFMMGVFQSSLTWQLEMSGQLNVPALLKQMDSKIQLIDRGTYWLTLLVLHIQPRDKTIQWWNAAAPPAVLIQQNGPYQTIVNGSSPLGSGREKIESETVSYQSGDRLVVATDGLYETRSVNDAEIGYRRSIRIFEKLKSASVEVALEQTLTTIDEWRGEAPMSDDLTLIFLDLK